MNYVQPTHFKFYVHRMVQHPCYSEDEYISDDGLHDLLHSSPKVPIAHELKVCSLRQNDSIETIVQQSESLETLELNIKKMDEDLIEIIKGKNWNELIFKNIEANDEERANEILANHQDISTLTLEYELLKENCFIPDIRNLQKIQFKFTGDMQRSFDDFTKVHELQVELPCNGVKKRKLCGFLDKCTNLKILKLNLNSKDSMNARLMRTILIALKNLEEIQLDADSKKGLDLSDEAFDVIKAEGKNLKKFTMTIDVGKADGMREKMKIFNDTKVRAVVMGKIFEKLDDEEKRVMPAVCIWKKQSFYKCILQLIFLRLWTVRRKA